MGNGAGAWGLRHGIWRASLCSVSGAGWGRGACLGVNLGRAQITLLGPLERRDGTGARGGEAPGESALHAGIESWWKSWSGAEMQLLSN